MRAVVDEAVVEPMIVLAFLRAADVSETDGLRGLGRDAEDYRHRPAERRLDGVLVADAVLQRDDRRGRVELAGEGAQRPQRIDRFDEEKEHLRSKEVARGAGHGDPREPARR